MRIVQAARLKQRLAERHGERVGVGERELAAFPAPAALRAVPAGDGVPERKLAWLRALADAALEGRLDGARLRALEPEQALAELRLLPGIGPFGAELVLLRGAAHPDRFPLHERRLHAEMAHRYGLADPTPPSSRPSPTAGAPTARGPRCSCARTVRTARARSRGG